MGMWRWTWGCRAGEEGAELEMGCGAGEEGVELEKWVRSWRRGCRAVDGGVKLEIGSQNLEKGMWRWGCGARVGNWAQEQFHPRKHPHTSM